MARVTIMQDDNTVMVDGVAASINCSSLPTYFRVIQWDGTAGHIEFDADGRGVQPPNLALTDFGPYQLFVEAHQRRTKEIADAEAAVAADQQELKDIAAAEQARQARLIELSHDETPGAADERAALRDQIVKGNVRSAEVVEQMHEKQDALITLRATPATL